MEAQSYLQKSLREKLDELKSRNNSFSLRAFARLLEVSPASLSEFLNGKRILSPKMINKLAEKLCLSPEEFTILNDKLVRDKTGVDPDIKTNKKAIQIQNDQYYLISDCHYYSILCLVETDDFINDTKWMANRLKTTVKKVKDSLERLLRLGFLHYNKDGKLECQDVSLSTAEDVPNTSIKKRHSENLDAAKESLYVDDVLLRDFNFVTIAIDPKKLPAAKKMIREFRNELMSFLESGEKTEVYEICTQIFPRSNVNKEEVYENFQ